MEVIKPFKGIVTDTPLDQQEEGTYTYALNTCLEIDKFGDLNAYRGNIDIATLPIGYHPIGKCYFNLLNHIECNLLFLAKDDGTLGQIGVFYNDSYLSLLFDVPLQNIVRCEYRLRRGCEHTFYYTDGVNDVRKLVLNDSFKVVSNTPLFRDFTEPKLKTSISNDGGIITTGSYGFALQYLDSDLNTSKFSAITNFVNVYSSDSGIEYEKLYGNLSNQPTSKSIRVEVSNLDNNYEYYRIAILKCGSGTGVITEVLYSNPIAFNQTESTFVYSGQIDGFTIGSLAEINIEPANIHTAEYVKQIDNLLTLWNTTDKIYDYCSFQQTVNNIKAYPIKRSVGQNTFIGNSKNSIYNKGFLSGEVYALGIVFTFKNGTKSPVYHINNTRTNPPNSEITTWSEDIAHLYSENEYNLLVNKLKWFQVYDTSIIISGKQWFNYYETSVDYPDAKGCDNRRLFPEGKITHHRFPEIDTNNIPEANTTKHQYGIVFENIVYPHVDIVGHEFVYAKRTDENKTILDKGILQGLGESRDYIGMSWLSAENNQNTKYNYFISPELLYNKKLPQGDYIQVEGVYNLNRLVAKVNGDNFNRGYDAAGSDWNDSDYIIETQMLEYGYFKPVNNKFKIREQRLMDYFSNQQLDNKQLINLSLTNRGVCVVTDKVISSVVPKRYYDNYYVSYRVIRDVYTNLYDLDYIKCHENVYTLTDNQECFEGDIFITELNYENTFFRQSLNGVWKGIATIATIIVGAALSILSAGELTGVVAAAVIALTTAATIIGASISIVAQAVALIISEVTNGKYDQLLNDNDNWNRLDRLFNGRGSSYVAYTSEILQNTIVESTINIGLRINSSNNCNTFYQYQTTFVDYCADKILYFDSEADKAGYVAKPVLCPEYYGLNLDYSKLNDIKVFKSLPITFYKDCCDVCYSVHKNRVYWSQQSFQEERIDNYTLILPNNYKDLPSEFGDITGVFRFNNGIYFLTPRSAYVLQQQYQERVTGQIVSFLGTGEYFAIPPRQLLNDIRASGGTTHELIQTPKGIIWVDNIYDNTVWLFDGKLNELSKGNSRWFINNLPESGDLKSNDYGLYSSGITMCYDDVYDVLYVTKNDFKLLPKWKTEVVNWFFGGIGDFVVKDNRYGFKQAGGVIEYVDIHDSNYFINRSWTYSFNFKSNYWLSFHSFTPLFYIHTKSNYHSVQNEIVRKHNIGYKINGIVKPMIVEFVFNKDTLYNQILNHLFFIVETKFNNKIFFNKLIAYNQYQSTGVIELVFNKKEVFDYFAQYTQQTENTALINKHENIILLNNLRNHVKTYTQDMFTNEWIPEYINQYPIDKVVNTSVVNEINWMQQDELRDRYVVVRLIYDNLQEQPLALKYIGNDKTLSTI